MTKYEEYNVASILNYDSPPSVMDDLRRFWLSSLGPLVLLFPNSFNYFLFWVCCWRLLQKTHRAH